MIRTDIPNLRPSNGTPLEGCYRCGLTLWHHIHNPERECYRDENGRAICTDCAPKESR